MVPQSAEHGKQFVIVCDHYLNYTASGFNMPIILGKPVDENDSGASALCFNCMDLAESKDFDKIPAGNICTDCFNQSLGEAEHHAKTHQKQTSN